MTDPITINGKTWHYDSQTRTHKPADATSAFGDRPADKATNVEPAARNESMAPQQGLPFDSSVCITVISYRKRLADSDGISAKAAIDGLVHCGILRDDSAVEVAEVRYRQIKVKTAAEEQTIIEIETV